MEYFTTNMRRFTMANQHINYDEKMRLITECRQSGLSDHQWCIRNNNISPSTFYTWISRLKNNPSMEPPKSQAITKVTTNAKHDVVQVNVVSNFPQRYHNPTSNIKTKKQ